MKKIGMYLITLLVALAMLFSSFSMVTADEPLTLNYDEFYTGHHSPIYLTDAGWGEGYQVTNDCTNGWGDDWWELTLTECAYVTIKVRDGFVMGDYFEVYIDGEVIGTTPDVGYPSATEYSVGEFTVELDPGTYLIEVKDALFVDPDYISGMCAAGYYVTITLDDITPYCVDLIAGGGGKGESAIDVGDVCIWSCGFIPN